MEGHDECRVRSMKPADGDATFQLAENIPEAAQWPRSDYDLPERPEYSGWVAVRHGALVGFLVVRLLSGEMEILNIGVDPRSRRQGIAARLLAAALDKAKQSGLAIALLEVRASNSTAISFYERASFRETGRRHAYYSNPTEDAVMMALELP